jgi:uncharacterized repeat protein (TIGR01451 family)
VTKPYLSPFLRLFTLSALVLLCLSLSVPLLRTGPAAQETGPVKIWLDNSHPLAVTYTGGTAGAIASGVIPGVAPQPVAMANGDFDQDGVSDLAVGFSAGSASFIAIHRGNLDAFAPQSEASFQAIAHNQFPSPFLPEAQTFAVPVSPDYIAAGDFTGHGHTDLVVASRGGSTLYVFTGDGKGLFSAGQTINLPGGVTSLGAGGLGRSVPVSNLLVGVSSPRQTFLAVYGVGPQGLGPVAAFPLSAPVSSINFGEFGEMGRQDAAFLSGGQVFILRASTMQLTKVSLPVSATAMALGSFVFDRNAGSQIALLGSDGSIHIAVRNEFDPRVYTADEFRAIRQARRNGQVPPLVPPATFPTNGWKIVESFPTVGTVNAGQTPSFFRTRVSNQGGDDVMWITSSGQMAVISHPNVVLGASTFVPGRLSLKPYSGSPVTAISTRVNVDGRPGILALHQGQMTPQVSMPLPDPTFFVNRTDDPAPTSPIANACNNGSFTDTSSSCSLREAVLKANGDTIMLQAGTTYTLTRAKVANDFSGQNGALYVNNSVTIVGGSGTIIQAGTTNATGVDMVMAVNEDINPITNASASLSNVTLQNGHNHGTHGNDGDGGCMEFDTGSSGTTTLTLTNVTLTNCSTTQGNGAGIAIFNFTNPGAGAVSISNSTISNNAANDSVTAGEAGGIWVSEAGRLTMSSSTVTGNTANNTNTTGGGGIATTNHNGAGSPTVTIHASTISGNQSAGPGGGINNETNLLVDQGSVISGNTTTSTQGGGGIFSDIVSCSPTPCTNDSAKLQQVTILNNKAPNGTGGGIFNGSGSGGGPLTISLSRIAGNSASTAASANLENDDTAITATNNWWGINMPASTITTVGASGTTTFDPFLVLSHTASPNKIRINQTATLTGDLGKDNHGNGNVLSVLNGVPITFNNAVLGSISLAQPALGATAQATATYNAGTTGGNGSADATVDQQTVTASIIVLQPPSITKSFNPTTVATNTPSTITFSITNGNTVTIESDFTDTLPAGLVVASPPNVVNTCGGTVTAAASATSISFTNAALAVGTCTIQVNVQSATDNVYNNSVTINSTDAGNGNTSSASLTVINPPNIAKAFGGLTVPLNGTTSLTLTLSSNNVNLTLNGVAFTDSLPSGLVVATPSNLNSTCSGTPSATAGGTSVGLTGASLAPGTTCTVSLNVTGTTAGVKTNSVTATSTNGGTSAAASASITVVSPPSISKSFGAASIALGGSTALSFTITNPNSTQSLSGVAFTDTLPAGLVISTPNGQSGTCGSGTITATAGTNNVSLSGGTIASSGSCTFSVNVTGTSAGVQNNTTGNVSSTEGGTGNTASASVTVVAPPSISKAFNPTTIGLNGTTTLTFTITNPGANAVAENGVAFSDTLPTGLVIATPNGLTDTCGGTASATAGTTSINLVGGTIAVNSSCKVTVTVTGTASGQYTNTSGAVSSTNGGTGNTATANLTVAQPPNITKGFGAASIPQGGTTSLTFNISNPNSGVAFTGLAFTDSLPLGLVVAPTPNLTNSCGGTASGAAGATSVTLSAGTLAVGASCTVSVNVQGASGGVKTNSVQASSNEGGTSTTATASITVIGAPSLTKVFGASSIALGGSTSLTFNITNVNAAQSLSGIAFTDTLPPGLVISTPNGQSGSCGSGTITATAGTNAISLAGGTLAASGSCSFSVNVTGTAPGTQNNTTSNVTSTEGGTGGTASAFTVVVTPPTIAKGFGPAGIQPNGVSILTITITNPAGNSVAQAGVAITDSLPANMVVATPNGLSNTCGGTASATSGTATVSLVGGSIGVNSSCTVSANVTSAFTGSYLNSTGPVSSTNGGTGGSASATLSVATPPTISKLFLPSTTVQNGTSLLSFTISNPNCDPADPSCGRVAPNTPVTLTGIAFTDSLPAGLVVASPNGLSNNCDGIVTAVPGSSAITFTGGDLGSPVGLIARRARVPRPALVPALVPTSSGTCSISVKVQATTQGTLNNTTGAIFANESGTGAVSNTASLTVTPPPSAPTLTKAFGAATIPANTPTTLTFTMTNPNAGTALSNIAFTDVLPSGMVVANPNGLPNGCVDPNATVTGQVSAVSGSNTVSLTSLSLNGAAQCSFSINVIGTTAGAKNNTTNAVTATFDDGTGTSIPVTGLPASATTTVLVSDLTIAKSHSGNFTQGDVGDTYQITVSNVGTVPTSGQVTVTDTPPAGLIPTALAGAGWTCTVSPLSCNRSDALANGASYPPITLTTSVAVNAPTSLINTATVSGGGETNTANDTATDTTNINQLPGPPLTIALMVPFTQTIKNGNSASFVFDVVSHSATLGNINFACQNLPAKSTCSFTPQTENQADAQVTMTLTTTADTAFAAPAGTRRSGTVFAAMCFPVLGLLSLAVAGRRGKRNRTRLVMFLGGLFVLIALFGCGGTPHNGTPIGAFPITVTATSAANPTVTATTQVVVTVQ